MSLRVSLFTNWWIDNLTARYSRCFINLDFLSFLIELRAGIISAHLAAVEDSLTGEQQPQLLLLLDVVASCWVGSGGRAPPLFLSLFLFFLSLIGNDQFYGHQLNYICCCCCCCFMRDFSRSVLSRHGNFRLSPSAH